MVAFETSRPALLLALLVGACICPVLYLHIFWRYSLPLALNGIDAQQSGWPVAQGVPLRILPLGDSITQGWMSTDNNGYRLTLRNLLNATGSSTEFIGSLRNGTDNPYNRHEGWGMHFIHQIGWRLRDAGTLQEQPNVVLLHAGTNDLHITPPKEPYEGAPERLGALIDFVLQGCPDAVVLVALIVHDETAQDRIDAFNAKVPGVVAARVDQGFRVRVVDHSVIGFDDLIDGIHPDDAGYIKMAYIWLSALRSLPKGQVVPPKNVSATRVDTVKV